MNRTSTLALLALCSFNLLLSCGSKGDGTAQAFCDHHATEADSGVETVEYKVSEGRFNHTYIVANQEDESAIYKDKVDKDRCFFVISKKEYRLYVYEADGKDTLLAASFPVAYAIYPEAKEKSGDNRTPECGMGNPFRISEIKDASTWVFDFDDGRGEIPAFGDWFMRLDLSKSFPDNEDLAHNRTIGIHGSTGNECSVPGRDSHGCVRLRDADLKVLHDNYAKVGTPVVIKGIGEGKLPFEEKAQQRLGDKYRAPKHGNPALDGKKKDTIDDTEPESDNFSTTGAIKASTEKTTKATTTTSIKAAPKKSSKTSSKGLIKVAGK